MKLPYTDTGTKVKAITAEHKRKKGRKERKKEKKNKGKKRAKVKLPTVRNCGRRRREKRES